MVVSSEKIGNIKANPNNPRLICQTCGTEFSSRKACKSRQPKYCTKSCYAVSLRKPPKEPKPRISRKGIPLSERWKLALSEGRKRSLKCKGENLYNWKGGQSTAGERSRIANKRRYHTLKGGGDLPISYLDALRTTQRNLCFYCEDSLKYDKSTHIEHLLPISRGGKNDWQNLVLSCQRCNNQKKDKTLAEFCIKNLRPDWLDKSFVIQINAINLSKNITA